MKEMKMPQKKVYIWELSRFWKFVVATDMTDMKSEEKIWFNIDTRGIRTALIDLCTEQLLLKSFLRLLLNIFTPRRILFWSCVPRTQILERSASWKLKLLSWADLKRFGNNLASYLRQGKCTKKL